MDAAGEDLVCGAGEIAQRRADSGHAFEHFAKERCLLPAHHFPFYRQQATETPWWRLSERKSRLPPKLIEEVLSEVEERGPITSGQLTDYGKVAPIDWNGWKGTSNAGAMALEVLWTQCKIVVCSREGGKKWYDIPERALPTHATMPAADFSRWALLERVEAAGLLSRNSGPHWSMLSHVRTESLPDDLIEEGLVEDVKIEGTHNRYLAPKRFLDRKYPSYDSRMRLLGPLDSLLWNRELIRTAFGFDYIWEVYKPSHQRRWGWYVYPLLHKGKLVGRLEGSIEDDSLKIKKIWKEEGHAIDEKALQIALRRHAEACGVSSVVFPKRRLNSA